eukprot:6187021-Pleurochrysis_carterae.AAC.1
MNAGSRRRTLRSLTPRRPSTLPSAASDAHFASRKQWRRCQLPHAYIGRLHFLVSATHSRRKRHGFLASDGGCTNRFSPSTPTTPHPAEIVLEASGTESAAAQDLRAPCVGYAGRGSFYRQLVCAV